jgi:murein DD-endopeptidase MepM/ murein hydrolase activator NlpD
VRIEHNNGYRCTCGHLSVVAVDEGTPITDAGTERGRIVAISGNTGFSAGAHLHFDVTPPNATLRLILFLIVDPTELLS